jgi:hypothetical protein
LVTICDSIIGIHFLSCALPGELLPKLVAHRDVLGFLKVREKDDAFIFEKPNAPVFEKFLERSLDLDPVGAHRNGDTFQAEATDLEDAGAVDGTHEETEEAAGLPRQGEPLGRIARVEANVPLVFPAHLVSQPFEIALGVSDAKIVSGTASAARDRIDVVKMHIVFIHGVTTDLTDQSIPKDDGMPDGRRYEATAQSLATCQPVSTTRVVI